MIRAAQKLALDTTPVILRPDKGNWGTITFFALVGIAPLLLLFIAPIPMTTTSWILVSLLVGMFLIPAVLFAFWQAKAVVIADETGLRWRGFGDWRTANWAEVSDYYDQLLAAPKPRLTVETNAGRLRLNSGLWTATPALREVIGQKAIQAKAKEWGLLGMRPEADWPRVFHYDTSDNRFQRVVLVTLVLVAGFLIWEILPGASRTAATMGLGWGLATIAVGGFGILPIGLYLAIFLRLQSATRRRKHQRITLTQAGVLYTDEHGSIKAPWRDITDLNIARGQELSSHYVVTAKQGTFDFSPSIKESAILRRAFPRFATALPEEKWNSTESDILGSLSSRWTSRCEGVGKRIYHYRTRTNRALLWFPTVLVLVFPLMYGVQSALGLATGSIGGLIGYGNLALWAWWRYSTASIQTDTEGITQRTLFGTKHLAWPEIIDYYQSGDDVFKFGILRGTSTRLWFWIGIADVESLKSEIARQAVNSLHHTWNTDTVNE